MYARDLGGERGFVFLVFVISVRYISTVIFQIIARTHRVFQHSVVFVVQSIIFYL